MPTIDRAAALPPFILTIDIGSSSTRALLYDAQARRVDGIAARTTYQIATGSDGASEIDAEWLLDCVRRCIDSVLDQTRDLQIAGVALDTFVSNIVALDATGKPLSQLITYADTRNDEDARRLRHELDEPQVHERTGCLLRTSYWPARLAWFRRTQPAVWEATRHWVTFGEFLELRLFGQGRAGISAASWSGLVDRQSNQWDQELLDSLQVAGDRLSPLVDSGQGLRGLNTAYANRWPALRDVPWFPALGDGAAANIGSGCDNPQRIALTVGTTAAMRVVLPRVEQVPHGLWCYRVDTRRALLGGATSEGGNVYAWLHDTTRLGPATETEPALAGRAPDAHGLTVLPFWAGERSPGWAGDARAAIVGMTLATTPLDLLHASLESVAYRFALIADNVLTQQHAATGSDEIPAIIVSGASLQQSPAWAQMMADVLQQPLIISNEAEATSRGAALIALEALGIIQSTTDLPAEDGAVIEPNPDHRNVYRSAIERQQALYHAIIVPE